MVLSQQATRATDPDAPSDPPHEGWEVARDPRSGHVVMRFPEHVTARVAAQATAAAILRLREERGSRVVVADLLDVKRFDAAAPVAALQAAMSGASLIARVELVVRNRLTRVAAQSAARVLGLSCTVRLARP